MKLYELLNNIKIKCSNIDLNMEIEGIASDSRKIKKGYVFVAITGEKRDGNDYIKEALQNGAVAIISEKKLYFDNSIPYIIVKNARKALAQVWSSYYQNPTKDLKVIAITGTNGKTSCAYLLYSILKKAYKKCGLISTIECLVNDEKLYLNGGSEVSDISSSMTTPDPEYLYKIFYEMRKNGIEYVVMEASSHALSQEKMSAANVYLAAFTNLTSEHLDYHKSIDSYFKAKKKLFEMCKIGIVNLDDEYGKILKNEHSNLYTFSCNKEANYYVKKAENIDTGWNILADLNGEEIKLTSFLSGKFVPQNVLTAVAMAKILKVKNIDIAEGVKACCCVSGRMEKIKDNVFIDYAHTPEAMEKAITSIKEICNGKKVIVLFGCGGDRDKTKRPIMGKIAYDLADEIVITSDNSRSEGPMKIINDILKGVGNDKQFYVIPNRREAISFLINKQTENQIILLLGKGHEKYEIDNNGKHYFDEREIIINALK